MIQMSKKWYWLQKQNKFAVNNRFLNQNTGVPVSYNWFTKFGAAQKLGI